MWFNDPSTLLLSDFNLPSMYKMAVLINYINSLAFCRPSAIYSFSYIHGSEKLHKKWKETTIYILEIHPCSKTSMIMGEEGFSKNCKLININQIPRLYSNVQTTIGWVPDGPKAAIRLVGSVGSTKFEMWFVLGKVDLPIDCWWFMVDLGDLGIGFSGSLTQLRLHRLLSGAWITLSFREYKIRWFRIRYLQIPQKRNPGHRFPQFSGAPLCGYLTTMLHPSKPRRCLARCFVRIVQGLHENPVKQARHHVLHIQPPPTVRQYCAWKRGFIHIHIHKIWFHNTTVHRDS